ncbi:hypothetical protein FIBSPDRAFT_1042991 [Athelia psychrophila]|uniref:DUF6533 domain-containing protein n=1 Tax=Athelia psychrophila TaxID=1759441 RepID=A0A166LSQ8_9AGAM|nr:hypothetical protein FIBSPDRAFT_1042991 [Fibularhizoctonia sp. CBS 109695]
MAQLLPDIQSQLNTIYYTSLVSFVILCYDYSLTFADEVERFWNRKNFTWASLFYFINRYLVLLGNIPVLFVTFWETNSLSNKTLVILGLVPSCARNSTNTLHRLLAYNQLFLLLSQLVIAILLIMRIYAMYNRSRWIIVVFAVIAVTAIALGCWASLGSPTPTSGIEFYYAGCNIPTGQRQADRLAVVWMTQLGLDALVFFLIVYKSFLLRRSRSKILISVLLRDGTLYFAIMTAANLANIVTILIASPLTKGAATFFTNVISATMMSRLMLNLRDPRMLDPHTGLGRTAEGAVTTTLPVMTSVFLKDDQPGCESHVPFHVEDIEMIPRDRGP